MTAAAARLRVHVSSPCRKFMQENKNAETMRHAPHCGTPSIPRLMGRLNADITYDAVKDPRHPLYSMLTEKPHQGQYAGLKVTCCCRKHVTALLMTPLLQLAALVPGTSTTRAGVRVSRPAGRGIVMVIFRVATAAVRCIVIVAVVVTEPRVTGLAVGVSAIAVGIRSRTGGTISSIAVVWVFVLTIYTSIVVRIVVGVVPLSVAVRVVVLTVPRRVVVSTIARSRVV